MEFNSLDAQREACEAYVASQKAEGWLLVPDRYDDGGFSGGTLERPALQRLTADIEAGRVDVVVVYKSTACPAAHGFREAGRGVRSQQRHLRERHAVVQHDDLDGPPHAECPPQLRPVRTGGDGERIRDKFAASRKKGIGWADGPRSATTSNRKLMVSDAEAAILRSVFQRFLRVGSMTKLIAALVRRA